MANKGGIITVKDIIEEDALKFGQTYAKNVKEAIDANDTLVQSAKEFNEVVKKFKVATTQKEYITAKQEEALATQKSIDAIKKQEAAEISAMKIKKEAITLAETERKAKAAVDSAELKLQKTKQGTVKLTIEERVQNEYNNRALKQAAIESLGLLGPYQKLNRARAEAKNRLRDLIAAEGDNTKAIKVAQKEYDILDKKVRHADAAVGDFTKNVGNYPFQNVASGLKNLIAAFGVTGGIAAFASVMKAAYQTVKEFEQGVADLSAITGASGKDLDYLKNRALDLGKNVKGGAIAVVEAYKLIASAKPELLENVQALNEVTEAAIKLAQASGQELPDAATSLTDALNQFNAPASEAGRFVDALANGAKYGAAEIPQVTEALLKFGAVARNTNVNIKESTALVELLAENGLKGADAGTALRNVLLKINAPDALPKKAQAALKDLGISFDFLKDKTIPVQEKFEALKPLLNDNAALVQVFGLENVVAAQNIIGHTDRLRDLTSKMGEFGTAEEQANIRMDTLQGDTEKLGSTYDALVLSIGKGSGVISEFFRFFVQGAKNALEDLIRLNTSWDELFGKAREDGGQSGKKLFDSQFASLIGEKMSDKQRQKIRDRIKEIDAEITKGSKDPTLRTEKNDLLAAFGGGSDEEVAKSIKTVARRNLEMYQEALAENNKKLKAAEDGKFGLRNPFAPSPKDLKQEKERLIKAIAEQSAIIKAAKTKINEINTPVTQTDAPPPPGSGGESDAEIKKRLAAEKKAREERLAQEKAFSDAWYELQKQRLEQAISINKEISDDEKLEDEVRVQALYDAQQKQEDLLLLNKEHALEIEKLAYEKELAENVGNKANTELIEKAHSLNLLRINEEYANNVLDLNKKTNKAVAKINEFDESIYQKDLDAKISKLNVAMNEELHVENERFAALGDLQKKNRKEREKLEKEHEDKIFEIKKQAAIKTIELQIANLQAELAASDALPEAERLSAEKRQEIAEKLSKAIVDLDEVKAKSNEDTNNKKVKNDKYTAERLLEISQNLTDALGGLANAIFAARISNIDNEIAANDAKYAHLIELAGNDQRQKDLLTQEAEKKRQALEAKKRKEQQKQAIFEKAFTIAQIGLATTLAIIKAAAATAPTFWGVAIAAAIGAIQLATALATPLPKYKHGRSGGPAEYAYVGDGGVPEVIERKRGGIEITPATDTIVKLEEGDKVHSNVETYLKLQRASVMASINMQGRKTSEFQATQHFDSAYGKEILEELKETRKVLQSKKPIIIKNNIDIPHAIWAAKNTNWS